MLLSGDRNLDASQFPMLYAFCIVCLACITSLIPGNVFPFVDILFLYLFFFLLDHLSSCSTLLFACHLQSPIGHSSSFSISFVVWPCSGALDPLPAGASMKSRLRCVLSIMVAIVFCQHGPVTALLNHPFELRNLCRNFGSAMYTCLVRYLVYSSKNTYFTGFQLTTYVCTYIHI